MPTLEEELRADDTAADSEARLFDEATAAELADLLRVPPDVVVSPLAVNVVGDDVVVGLDFGIIELPETELVIYRLGWL